MASALNTLKEFSRLQEENAVMRTALREMKEEMLRLRAAVDQQRDDHETLQDQVTHIGARSMMDDEAEEDGEDDEEEDGSSSEPDHDEPVRPVPVSSDDEEEENKSNPATPERQSGKRSAPSTPVKAAVARDCPNAPLKKNKRARTDA